MHLWVVLFLCALILFCLVMWICSALSLAEIVKSPQYPSNPRIENSHGLLVAATNIPICLTPLLGVLLISGGINNSFNDDPEALVGPMFICGAALLISLFLATSLVISVAASIELAKQDSNKSTDNFVKNAYSRIVISSVLNSLALVATICTMVSYFLLRKSKITL